MDSIKTIHFHKRKIWMGAGCVKSTEVQKKQSWPRESAVGKKKDTTGHAIWSVFCWWHMPLTVLPGSHILLSFRRNTQWASYFNLGKWVLHEVRWCTPKVLLCWIQHKYCSTKPLSIYQAEFHDPFLLLAAIKGPKILGKGSRITNKLKSTVTRKRRSKDSRLPL